MGEYPLGEAFSLLGVDNMVKLLTCTLLETQILLYSQGQCDDLFQNEQNDRYHNYNFKLVAGLQRVVSSFTHLIHVCSKQINTDMTPE